MKESRCAFIIHPTDQSHLSRIRRQPNVDSEVLISPVRLITLPFVVNGQSTTCDVIFCPLLPEQMISDEPAAVSMILNCIEIAERYGAELVGLGGFTSIIGNGGLDVAGKASVPVTSGNTYTAASVVQSVSMAARLVSKDLHSSCVAIIGATGDIGSACAKALAGSFQKMILVARNDERLQKLARVLRSKCKFVSIVKQAGRAAAEADVVITVTSSLTTVIDAKDLKESAIICDVSYPANIARELHNERQDVLVYEGGIVSSQRLIPQIAPTSIFWDFNPKDGMHACFAETLLLALERIFTTYSIGRGLISSEKMYEIKMTADKYGFQPLLVWDDTRHDINGRIHLNFDERQLRLVEGQDN